jgi:glycosyltransferase involved in cell wall biosynthesis
MLVSIFRPFPDAYRKSMHVYADQLIQRVAAKLGPQDAIRDCLVPHPRTAPAWARYWDQYVRYQRFSKTTQGDVNHVVDHGYGHLLYSLPPERTVVTFHDATVMRANGVRWSTRLSLRYSLAAMRRAACIVTDSDAARRDLLEIADVRPERVRVVPLGVDPAFTPPADRDALRARHGLSGVCLLHVGHTQAYMNLPTVFRVLDRLVREHRLDARLLKVGTPFTPEQTDLLHSLRLDDRVQHMGRVDVTALAELYGACDLLLYPPLHAGFGLPVIEAMASGTPVVASNRGALPEVAGDAALLADADDDAALATLAARAVTDAATRERLRDAGLKRARLFDWDRTAADMLSVYRQIHGG